MSIDRLPPITYLLAMTPTRTPRPAKETRLRARNQLTLPDAVVRAVGLVEGDRLIVNLDPSDPNVVRLRRIRRTYAGALADVYGDATAALAEERASWPERGDPAAAR